MRRQLIHIPKEIGISAPTLSGDLINSDTFSFNHFVEPGHPNSNTFILVFIFWEAAGGSSDITSVTIGGSPASAIQTQLIITGVVDTQQAVYLQTANASGSIPIDIVFDSSLLSGAGLGGYAVAITMYNSSLFLVNNQATITSTSVSTTVSPADAGGYFLFDQVVTNNQTTQDTPSGNQQLLASGVFGGDAGFTISAIRRAALGTTTMSRSWSGSHEAGICITGFKPGTT